MVLLLIDICCLMQNCVLIGSLSRPPARTGIDKSSESDKRDSTRHRSSKSKMLVVSGGDGYEDFRLTNSSETVGRDDSTNHLLLWRV